MQSSADQGPGAATDWEAIERSPAFQELIRRKRRYVAPRVVLFLGWYLAFVLLAGYGEDFMGKSVYEGLTVGYVFALTQFVMVWFLAASYVRKANRDFDPLERKAIEHITHDVSSEPDRRFDPGSAAGREEVRS